MIAAKPDANPKVANALEEEEMDEPEEEMEEDAVEPEEGGQDDQAEDAMEDPSYLDEKGVLRMRGEGNDT